MKRTRELSKVKEHFIKRQGGCYGLKVTCDKQETETKTTNCEFVLVFLPLLIWLEETKIQIFNTTFSVCILQHLDFSKLRIS